MKLKTIEHQVNGQKFKFYVCDAKPHSKKESEHSENTLSMTGFLERSMEVHPDFFYLIDPFFKFRYVSPSLLALWDKTAAEVHGKGFAELNYPPELVDLHKTQLDLVLLGKVVKGENYYTGASGERRFYEYIFSPLCNEIGQVEMIAGVTRDISDRKRLELEKERLLATIAHDLRTPLGVIKGIGDLLHEQKTESTGPDLSKMLLRNAIRLENLVNNLLDSASIQAGELIHLDLTQQNMNEIVNEAYLNLTLAWGSLFEIKLPEEQLFAPVDGDAVQRVIENLGHNAVKYGDLSHPITLSLRKINDQKVCVGVHNCGPAIPQEKLETIFELHFRETSTNEYNRKGWGIGLTVVKELVKAHRGQINLSSSEKEGTLFEFSLPTGL